MTPTRQGSFHLFRFAGVDVFLHWSWFLIAAYEITTRGRNYSSMTWNALEYLALFLIVLLHEFGHSLACRSVGGRADQIVLWPLGGVAYVNPPPRPGATLWSIAAGPLVNVVLVPIFSLPLIMNPSVDWLHPPSDIDKLIVAVWAINLGLLIFNLLPIYPLDGGQILRSLLWFVLGRARSLLVATIIGLLGVAAFLVFAFKAQSGWYGILGVFILMNCWGGFMQARVLIRLAKAPRHAGFECPACKTAPPVGEFWVCGHCRKPFDMFATRAMCPHCQIQFPVMRCLDCGHAAGLHEWIISTPTTPSV